jgi:hypothetical protein
VSDSCIDMGFVFFGRPQRGHKDSDNLIGGIDGICSDACHVLPGWQCTVYVPTGTSTSTRRSVKCARPRWYCWRGRTAPAVSVGGPHEPMCQEMKADLTQAVDIAILFPIWNAMLSICSCRLF